MSALLSETEARVLGALIEKEITTPDYYPLSMNALLNACNQKSNREPVTELEEDTVREALHRLDDKGLAGAVRGSESRVTKYEHRFSEAYNFGRRDVAVLCVLLLRGAQTPGELRGRTDRLYQFSELSDVQTTLQRLIERDPPLVKVLPRQPGTKEPRYMHLFSGDRLFPEAETIREHAGNGADPDRIQRLEERLTNLQQEVAKLRDLVEGMRSQDS